MPAIDHRAGSAAVGPSTVSLVFSTLATVRTRGPGVVRCSPDKSTARRPGQRSRTLRCMPNGDARDLRLAELVAAFSLATDLGMGQPMEHVLRSWRIAAGLGERIGLDEATRGAVLRRAAGLGGLRRRHLRGGDLVRRRHRLPRRQLPGRSRRAADAGLHAAATSVRAHRRCTDCASAGKLIVTGGQAVQRGLMSHCSRPPALAEQFGLGADVCAPLQQMFARWDGKGVPPDGRGEQDRAVDPAVPRRRHRRGPLQPARRRRRRRGRRERRGAQFDPDIVDEFCRARARAAGQDRRRTPTGSALIDAEPGLRTRALASLKSTMRSKPSPTSPTCGRRTSPAIPRRRRSRRRRRRRDRTPGPEVVLTRRAGLLHDIGDARHPRHHPGQTRAADHRRDASACACTPTTPSACWPGPPTLARLGAIAASHHERPDGSGYHRGLRRRGDSRARRGCSRRPTRTSAMTRTPRRTGLRSPPSGRQRTTRRGAAGRLDAEAVDAVLAAAGHTRRKAPQRAGRAHTTRDRSARAHRPRRVQPASRAAL